MLGKVSAELVDGSGAVADSVLLLRTHHSKGLVKVLRNEEAVVAKALGTLLVVYDTSRYTPHEVVLLALTIDQYDDALEVSSPRLGV